ncbi:hypothetical protein LUX29_12385 [Aureimonas altamirensis]|uniref:hypothetical protein n=1 Tax=Aureimonas altamirensis TaxID=370622 RepID=UPI001E4F2200|nr:hypothetical protein [Aureimonas altamirensis]UHD43888.1 hypothetical protein LUX29_12385 [Aureimonas altamirensis]
MADSENSRTLTSVTRRSFLSTVAAWLTLQTSGHPAVEDERGGENDPTLHLWREWMIAHGDVDKLCRRQQYLERRVMEVISCSDPAPDEELGGVRACTERQPTWNEIAEEFGYPKAKAAEATAMAVEESRAKALWAAPARSPAGAAAKLHALLLRSEEGALSRECPWPQIRSVIRNLMAAEERRHMRARGQRPLA